jgi:cell division protein FtsN
VNRIKLRLSAAALAASFLTLPAGPACIGLFLAGASALAPLAQASLSDHPEPSKLDPVPPPAPSAAPSAPAAEPAVSKPAPAKPEAAQASASPASAAALREEILALARKGLLDSAAALCKTVLQSSPDDAFLLLMMGKLSPGGKESSEYFKKAVKAAPASPEAEESLFRLGQFNYAAGKYHLAIPFFRDYLRLFPKGDWKEPAAYWMGNACLSLAQGRPDKAAYLDSGAAWFQKLLDRSKPVDYYYPLALEGLAKARAAKGDRDGAWESARSALDKAPEEERSPLLLLAAQLRQGVNRDEEKSLMAQLVSRYPQSPEARYLRKINAGLDTSKWKAGSGLPRPSLPPAKDSIASAPAGGAPAAAAPAVPATAPADAAGDVSAGKGYTLQLGAFSQSANAQAMMANLAKLGFAPELAETDRGGKRIYQVRIGRFATAEEASEYAKEKLKPHRFLSQPVPVGP